MGPGQCAAAGDTEDINDGGVSGVEMEALGQLANSSVTVGPCPGRPGVTERWRQRAWRSQAA